MSANSQPHFANPKREDLRCDPSKDLGRMFFSSLGRTKHIFITTYIHHIHRGDGRKTNRGTNSIELVYLQDPGVLEKYAFHQK